MTTTATTTTAKVRRTYETFDIVFDGATWTGYDTAAEAAAFLAGCSRPGTVVRRTFHVDFEPGSRLLEISRRCGRTPISEVAVA